MAQDKEPLTEKFSPMSIDQLKRAREKIVELSQTPASEPEPKMNLMEFFTHNVDNWGAVEWFDRMAKAIREQDKAVTSGAEGTALTCRNVALSSAYHLVREFEQQVRAALVAPQEPPLPPEVPEYRLLTRADKIEPMDQIMLDDTVTWASPQGWEIGVKYDPSIYQPARRRVGK